MFCVIRRTHMLSYSTCVSLQERKKKEEDIKKLRKKFGVSVFFFVH